MQQEYEHVYKAVVNVAETEQEDGMRIVVDGCICNNKSIEPSEYEIHKDIVENLAIRMHIYLNENTKYSIDINQIDTISID